MSPFSTSPESPPPSTYACQSCGTGCHYAAAVDAVWLGEWIWCEHPHRLHAARLIRADSECHRFESILPVPAN